MLSLLKSPGSEKKEPSGIKEIQRTLSNTLLQYNFLTTALGLPRPTSKAIVWPESLCYSVSTFATLAAFFLFWLKIVFQIASPLVYMAMKKWEGIPGQLKYLHLQVYWRWTIFQAYLKLQLKVCMTRTSTQPWQWTGWWPIKWNRTQILLERPVTGKLTWP